MYGSQNWPAPSGQFSGFARNLGAAALGQITGIPGIPQAIWPVQQYQQSQAAPAHGWLNNEQQWPGVLASAYTGVPAMRGAPMVQPVSHQGAVVPRRSRRSQMVDLMLEMLTAVFAKVITDVKTKSRSRVRQQEAPVAVVSRAPDPPVHVVRREPRRCVGPPRPQPRAQSPPPPPVPPVQVQPEWETVVGTAWPSPEGRTTCASPQMVLFSDTREAHTRVDPSSPQHAQDIFSSSEEEDGESDDLPVAGATTETFVNRLTTPLSFVRSQTPWLEPASPVRRPCGTCTGCGNHHTGAPKAKTA